MVWSNYEYQPSFLLGFHGCDRHVGEKILQGKEQHLKPSEKEYDWLGHGIYFWEGNPSRAMDWAEQRKSPDIIKEPFVIGAIIDLRRCLDLFDKDALAQVKATHAELLKFFETIGEPPPKNVGATPDKLGRKLDCAVMNALHAYREQNKAAPYDSIRGAFLEGNALYEGAGFRELNHIQLCIRNTDCIKGYFRPIPKS